MNTSPPPALEGEARELARYVAARPLQGEALAAVVDRYVRAHAHLNLKPAPGLDAAITRAALRRRALLGPLDAACALRLPGGTLRRKLVLMSALVETLPGHARDFIPPARVGTLRLARTFALAALVTAGRLAVGLPAWWVIAARAGRSARVPSGGSGGG